MNYTNFIVKMISKPEQSSFKNGICVTEFIGKFYQFRNKRNINRFCKISIWGNSGSNLIKYSQLNDYLIIEGYISFRKSIFEQLDITTVIELSVFKFYPFSLKK